MDLGDGSALVEDLGSTNGTTVNGQRLSRPRVIHPGDRVLLGQTTLELHGPVGADPTVVAPRPAAAPAVASVPVPPGSHSARTADTPPVTPGGPNLTAVLAVAAVVVIGVGIAAYLIGHSGRKTVVTHPAATAARSLAPSPSGGTTVPVSTGGAPAGGGVVYIESNLAQPNGNGVLAFRYLSGGDLRPTQLAEYPTGGAGAEDLTDSGVLDADHHLYMDTAKRLLFAVNQGSDTIAVFHVAADGTLTAVAGSPFPSGGFAPASVSVSGDTAIVANKAQDGVRNLEADHPNYVTFHIGPDGSLAQFGPTITAPLKNSPTDVNVAPDGKFILGTEEGGPFRAFELGSGGLVSGSNSPLEPDVSIFPAGLDPSKRWGLGIADSPAEKVVYIGMATVNKIAVYSYDDTGRLTFIRAVPLPGAVLPCWLHLNAAGTRLYTANAGNNTMSVLDTSNPTDPRAMQTIDLHANGNPWDFSIDPTGKLIFLIDPRARMNVPPGEGQGLHTLLINSDGTLTEPSYSPAPVPAALGQNPYGMAILGQNG